VTSGRDRIALVHDYLNQRGGAERVFAHIAAAYPDAPIYTSLCDARATGDLVDPARVRTSFLQRLPGSNRYFRYLAPLYPRAFESFDLRAFDLVVSSTTAWAKGVRTNRETTHVCYINTVSRFAFAYEAYVGGLAGGGLRRRLLGAGARPLVGRLTRWDRRAAERPTAFVANSANVAARVARYYGRGAFVLPCPVDVHRFAVGAGEGDYYLVVSRLLPYKAVERAVRACAAIGARLVVVGEGPARASVAEAARGTRTELLGAVDDGELRRLMGAARAIVLPGEEDFGLVPIEANAAGRPAIALGRGGALETVRPGVTGLHFPEPTVASLAGVLRGFDPDDYDPIVLRAHAETFAPERFTRRLRRLVDRVRDGARPEEPTPPCASTPCGDR